MKQETQLLLFAVVATLLALHFTILLTWIIFNP